MKRRDAELESARASPAETPDVVFADVLLPDMTEVELARSLEAVTSALPVLQAEEKAKKNYVEFLPVPPDTEYRLTRLKPHPWRTAD